MLVIWQLYHSYLFESHSNISSGHFPWLPQLFTNDLVSGCNGTVCETSPKETVLLKQRVNQQPQLCILEIVLAVGKIILS